jgi:ligand-binding sensor domain-containing protein
MRARWLIVVIAIQRVLVTEALALDGHRSVTQYTHSHYETRDGMPHGLTNSIAETADGYLWTGSEEGLARFDGAAFTTFDHRKTEGIPANAFTALAVDGAGTLWAGTREHGLLHLIDGEFRAVVWEPGAQGQQIRTLAFDRSGDLWVGTRDRGLVHLHLGVQVAALTASDGLPSNDIRSLLVDRDGTLWIGTFDGLARWRAGLIERGPAALDHVAIDAIAQDAQGELWCATENGLAWLHGDIVESVGSDQLPASDVHQILFDRDGNLWIGTGLGVARRTPDGRIHQLAIPGAMVLALFEDAEANLWIGSEKGLDRLRDGDVLPFGAGEGVTDEAVFGVREDPAGALWIGSADGLLRIPPGETTATKITEHGTMYAIYPDHRGDVWFGARDGGIGRWHDGRFSWLGKRPWERVRAIVEAGDGIWIGTNHGLFRLRGDRLDDAEAALPGPIISAILPDATGALWLGTEGQGLLRWKDGGFLAIPAGGPPATSSVVTIQVDPDGTLWAGTEGSGLWRLRDDKWAGFTSKDGMFDDVIWRILDDGLGNLWMSSNRGIWSVSRAQLAARASGELTRVESMLYGEADGMRDRECNGAIDPAGWRTRDGRLWFPTGKGLAVIDPAHLTPASPPNALIESVRVDGQPHRLATTIELAPGSSRLELGYTAPALRSPERLRFRYRLDGFDRAWNDAGAQRVAQYTNLAPGTYEFIVEAGIDGKWGKRGTVTALLPPLFYQTGWFFGMALVLIVLAIVAVPLLRVRQLRARGRELDARVQEAVRELKVLSGLLPICAWCKKIRDDKGYWSRIEAYLSARTDAQFTHGICPDCNAKLIDEAGQP